MKYLGMYISAELDVNKYTCLSIHSFVYTKPFFPELIYAEEVATLPKKTQHHCIIWNDVSLRNTISSRQNHATYKRF